MTGCLKQPLETPFIIAFILSGCAPGAGVSMSHKKKNNIVRYKKPFHINIGVIIFVVIFVYFAVCLISYATKQHVSVYEVQKGQIAQKNIYTGLILRTEEIVTADSSGTVNYYITEGDKVGKNDLVCSIDEEGDISDQISEAGLDGTQLSESSLEELEDTIKTYVNNFSEMSFYDVTSFKTDIDAQVQESLYRSALESLSEETDAAVGNNTFEFLYSETDGIAAMYTDGFESVTPDTFEDSMFDTSAYTKSNLNSTQSVASGDAVYKLCTDENWYIMVPVDEETAQEYEEEEYANVTFRKDNTEATPEVEVRQYDDQYYLVLSFNSSMVRFISDRYVELEIGNDDTKGLKIPNSAIVEKEFIVIPKKYFTEGGDSTDQGVIKVVEGKDGSTVEFIETELYYETETAYYVSEDDLELGDQIQNPDTSEIYTLETTDSLQGVYNINKGYAVFKQIEIIAQNEEYAILQTGTSYGLSLYDRIAMDGTEISEGELVN